MSAFAGILQSTHGFIAMIRREPHWNIDDADAKRYTQCVANVLRHTSIAVGQKYMDYLALGFCAIHVEGARVLMSAKIAEARRRGPQPVHTAQVFQFNNPPSSPAAPSGNGAERPAGAAAAEQAPPVEGFNPEFDPLSGGSELN